MLRVSDLTVDVADGSRALEGVDLAAEPGELVAVVGHNGAGKTTLLTAIAGLVEPDGGSVEADGVVGYSPADPRDALFARTVREEVAYFPRNRGLEVGPRTDGAIAAMSLEGLADRSPTSLSTGEQRRTAIAAVLSGDPAVLALDEPTAGLDAHATASLGGRLEDLEAAVVCATHDADFAYRYADAAVVLADGAVRAAGPAREVLRDAERCRAAGVRPPGPVAWAAARGLEPPEDLAAAVELDREAGPVAVDEAGGDAE